MVKLQQSASRFLLNAAQLASTQKSIIDGLLLPMIKTYEEKPALGPRQHEVLSRIIETTPADYLYQFFSAIANDETNTIVWNEDCASLLRLIVNQMATHNNTNLISNAEFSSLLLKLDECAPSMKASSKFPTMIFTLITKLPVNLILANADLLRSILEPNTTFMKKSALTALDKLK